MIKPSTGLAWQRALIILTGTVVGVVVVTILYWAQSIFIPVALAAFLTFLLNPLVSWLRQRGIARAPAVISTVGLAALGLGLVVWVVTTQISGLLRELPEYSQNMREKAKSLRHIAERSNRFTKMVLDINQELGLPTPAAATKEGGLAGETAPSGGRPTAVVIEPQSPIWLSRITSFLAPLMEPLGEFALAIILVVFMLQKREEVRNRIIRLAGDGRIAAATRFVDEAGQRISRFLLMQAIVNGTFGLVLGLGLLLIGVKYALLWGFLAAMFRYLPYVWPFLAAVFPISLSLAMFDGWGTTLAVAALFLSLELVVANFVEPWLYGQSMGVSEIALLVSAAFWAFLWGPVGLVLSSPLTVCLVMLGRYVPQLEFLAILLGDEPALDPSISFYQRLLARDQDEAEELILERLKTQPLEGVYDEMLIPALSATKLCRARGDITEADEREILQSIREIALDVGERPEFANRSCQEGGEGELAADRDPRPPIRILGCPARDAADRAALEMLGNLLDPVRWNLEAIAPDVLTAELLDRVAATQPSLVCIATTPPGGLAHARYLCKRLRARFPDLRIVVGRWARQVETQPNPGQLLEAGANSITATLLETRQELASLLPILAQNQDKPGLPAPIGRADAIDSGPVKRGTQGRRASDRDLAATAVSS